MYIVLGLTCKLCKLTKYLKKTIIILKIHIKFLLENKLKYKVFSNEIHITQLDSGEIYMDFDFMWEKSVIYINYTEDNKDTVL